jgi:hypothetical protein
MDDPDQIKCPRNPDHGIAVKRWLPWEERGLLTKAAGDAFAITCPHCGEYEMVLSPRVSEVDSPK